MSGIDHGKLDQEYLEVLPMGIVGWSVIGAGLVFISVMLFVWA